MIRNYLKTAWKNLLRNKVYGLINITGLGLGLACCMLIILYCKDELSYDRFNGNTRNIYRITCTDIAADGKVKGSSGITGMMPGPAFKSEVSEVKDFVRLQGGGIPVKIGAEIFDQGVLYVDDNFFSVFTFPLIEGNSSTCLKDIHSVVISQTVAWKFFGKADAMGKIIELPVSGNRGSVSGNGFEGFTLP
jgi:putative ABC transport system permease protein